MMEMVSPIFLEPFCVFNSVHHFYSILCLFGPALPNLCAASHPGLWLTLWFPALDCSKLQYKYANKNFSLFSGGKKKEWSALCNCLQPNNPTPLSCLQWPSQSTVTPMSILHRPTCLWTDSILKVTLRSQSYCLQVAQTGNLAMQAFIQLRKKLRRFPKHTSFKVGAIDKLKMNSFNTWQTPIQLWLGMWEHVLW